MKPALLLLVAAAVLSAGVSARGSEPVVRFGLIADIQYADADTSGSRYYRNSLAKLDECVETLNREGVAFTINLGDAIDRDPADLDTVLERLRRLKRKVFNTTGNHDYSGAGAKTGGEAEAETGALYKKLGMPSEYYSFKKKGWVFILLNTNEVSEYSGAPAAKEELSAMYGAVRAHGGRQAASYNGGIGRKQLQWLRSELAKAERKGKKVLVFSHHPLWPDSGVAALNNLEILDALDDYPCVKAVFCGHHHAGGFAYRGDIPVVTVEGMVETERENAFGVVELYDDRITVRGTGRMNSRELEYKTSK